jgi:acetylornithine deacetylase
MNAATIRGGTALNVIAEECRLAVSCRALPGVDPAEIGRVIRERIAAIDPRDGGGGEAPAAVEVREIATVPAMLSPRGSSLETALFDALGVGESGGAPFAADGCRFAEAGIVSLLCGPGDIEEAHQPNESIAREALERGPELILEVVRRLCAR